MWDQENELALTTWTIRRGWRSTVSHREPARCGEERQGSAAAQTVELWRQRILPRQVPPRAYVLCAISGSLAKKRLRDGSLKRR